MIGNMYERQYWKNYNITTCYLIILDFDGYFLKMYDFTNKFEFRWRLEDLKIELENSLIKELG